MTTISFNRNKSHGSGRIFNLTCKENVHIMKKFLLLLIVAFFAWRSFAATVNSTVSGGNWNATTTWIGGVVPASTDDVILNGPVVVNGFFTCRNLTIQANANMVNHAANTNLTINGNLVNNGTVSNDPTLWVFTVIVNGNLTNNGTWKPIRTQLGATSAQVISASVGKWFEGEFTILNASNTVSLGSNVAFKDNHLYLNKAKIDADGFVFYTLKHNVHNGWILSNNTIHLDQSFFDFSKLSGNFTLEGKTIVGYSDTLTGNIILLDTIYNQSAATRLVVDGNLTNNGALTNDANGYPFEVNLRGNFHNNGYWNPRYTNLDANVDQTLSQTSGKWLEGQFNISDLSGNINLASDIAFKENHLYFNGGKINGREFLFYTLKHNLHNGWIESSNRLHLDQSFFDFSKLSGNFTLEGKTIVGYSDTLTGNIILLDTIYNQSAATRLLVYGNLTNNGALTNDANGYPFEVNLRGNFHNNGYWNPRYTNLDANVDQTLSQTSGKWLEGQFNISDLSGNINLASDIAFKENHFYFNGGKINAGNFVFYTLKHNLHNGWIESSNRLHLDQSFFDFSKLSGNFTLEGKAIVGYSDTLKGNITLTDTIVNHSASTALLIDGNLTNNGVLQNDVNGYPFEVYLRGNFHNNGYWNPRYTYLDAKTDQTISQTTGKWLEGQFKISDLNGKVILGSDLAFKDNFLMLNNGTIDADGFVLFTLNHNILNGTIRSNKTLHLHNSYFEFTKLEGNFTLEGKTRIGYSDTLKGNITLTDTIINQSASTALLIDGNLTNNGVLKNDVNGYPFEVYLKGNFHNNGYWNPRYTYLDAKTDQTISQTSGKWMEGQFTISDTSGKVLLGSAIYFRDNYLNLNGGKITTNGFNFNANAHDIRNGTILGNDTLHLANSFVQDCRIDGNYFLKGKTTIGYNNYLLGNATLIDTFVNHAATTSLFVKGNLLNKGAILRQASGYSMLIYAEGDVLNEGVINNVGTYLVGKSERTVAGKLPINILCPVYVDDSVRLVGNNIIPNLTITNKTSTLCIIQPGANLKVTTLTNNPNRIANYGKLETTFDFPTHPLTYNFYHTSFKSNANSKISRLSVEHFGYQDYPTATGAVQEWWRIKSLPAFTLDSLNLLELSYAQGAINGNSKKDLKVYYSPNAGINWKILKNVTNDTVNNKISATNCPSNGHFVLSTDGAGLNNFRPLVEKAEPTFFGNSGRVTIYGFGAGFKKNMSISISRGNKTYQGEDILLTDISGESFVASFVLADADTGYYDLSVTIPGDNPMILKNQFHVEKTTRPDPWAILSGRDRFLLNKWSTFYINYGNKANVDAVSVPLNFVVNDVPGMEVEFPDIQVDLPQVLYDSGYTMPIDSNFALYYVTDSLTGYIGTNMRVYAFLIPNIRAGSSEMIRVQIKLKQAAKLNMDLWVMDPFAEGIPPRGDVPPEVAACLTAAALKYWFDKAVTIVPGYECFKLIYKVANPVSRVTPDGLLPPKTSFWSQFWNGCSWTTSILKCAGELNPAYKIAAIGSKITSTIIDIGQNQQANKACWDKFKDKGKTKLGSSGVASMDPNEIVGPHGYDTENYISNKNLMNYRVFFENKDSAMAPANDVIILDTLDAKKFDFQTFSFGDVVIADSVYTVQPYAKSFSMLIDLFPRVACIVKVYGNLDTTTGIIKVEFNTLDRYTKEPNDNVDVGFLPPNVANREGEANFSYTLALKAGLPHNAVITNKASIYFDANPPIATNTYSNKLDLVAPSSAVLSLAGEIKDSLFLVDWSGNDNGCGIRTYNIFVSENDSAYVNWLPNTALTSASFKGKHLNRYKFFSIAADSVGNLEAEPLTADASTKLKVSIINLEDHRMILVYPNPTTGILNIDLSALSGAATLKLYDLQGQQHAEREVQTGELVSWNLSQLRPSSYVLVVETSDKKYHKTIVFMNN